MTAHASLDPIFEKGVQLFVVSHFLSGKFWRDAIRYGISDIVIYFIYIDLMRKRCQLINVDVDVGKIPALCYHWKS